jgi:hypothetical protein
VKPARPWIDRAVADALPVTVRCSFCRWKRTGFLADMRAAALEHRRAKHPWAVEKTRRRSPAGETQKEYESARKRGSFAKKKDVSA